jgi:hypothetical protein
MNEKDLSVTLLSPATLLLLDERYYDTHKVLYDLDGGLNAKVGVIDLRPDVLSPYGLHPLSGKTLQVAYQHLRGMAALSGGNDEWVLPLLDDLLAVKSDAMIENADDVMVALLPYNVLETFKKAGNGLHEKWLRFFRETGEDHYLFVLSTHLIPLLSKLAEIGIVSADGRTVTELDLAITTLWVLPPRLDRTTRIALGWWLGQVPVDWQIGGTARALETLGDVAYPTPPRVIDDVLQNTG